MDRLVATLAVSAALCTTLFPAHASAEERRASTRLAQADTSAPTGAAATLEDPGWAAGRWAGRAECRSRIYELTINLPPKSEQMAPVLDYKFIALKDGARGAGSIRYALSTSRAYRLTSVHVLAGEQWHPFGQITISSARDGSPQLRSSGCGPLAQVRNETPQTVGAPALANGRAQGPTAVAAKPSDLAGDKSDAAPVRVASMRDDRIFGEWAGSLSCPRSPPVPIALWVGREDEMPTANRTRARNSAENAISSRYAAQLTQFVKQGRTGRAARQVYVGERLGEDGYRFARTTISYEVGIGDAVVRNFTLTWIPESREFAGAVQGELCTTFRLSRSDDAGSPDRPSAPVPRNGGLFWSNASGGGRCEALLAWSEPLSSQYSMTDFYAHKVNGAVLFMDDMFVPIFGRVVEKVGKEQAHAIADEIVRCRRDPLLRNRLELVGNLISPLRDERDALFVYNEARKTRAALLKVAAGRDAAQRERDPLLAIAALESVKADFSRADVSLSTKGRNDTLAALDAQFSTLAEKAIRAVEEKLPSVSDREQLDTISGIRRSERMPAKYLTVSSRENFLIRVQPLEASAAESIYEGFKRRATDLPRDVAGVAAFDKIETRDAFDSMSDQARSRYSGEWTNIRRDLFNAALAAERRGSPTAQPTWESLTEGATWFTSFRQRWTPYLKEEGVRAFVANFLAVRSQNLVLLVDKLREQRIRPAQFQIDRTLVLPEDRRNPIALDFALAAIGL